MNNKETDFKDLVAQNLIYYRKLNNLTQIQLAEILNYSDKSISKWERGEGLPDIYILHTIAELFGITLDDLTKEKKVSIYRKTAKPKTLITLIAVALCWLVATSAFVLLGIFLPNIEKNWLAFVYAIPASMIVIIVFSKLWGKRFFTFLSTTILIWTIPLSIYLSIHHSKLWLLFIWSIPLQVIMIFWFFLQSDIKKTNPKQ